jgi:5'-methylthioadenosine phosphorylase
MTARLGIITGSDIGISGILEGFKEKRMETPFGQPSSAVQMGLIEEKEIALLYRHGEGHTLPPHKVNHRANIQALSDLGVTKIIGASSVGSLKEEIRPSDLVIPSDYVSLWRIPTFHDDKVIHATPVLDQELREGLVECIRSLALTVHDGGVYVQTTGPRLETKAEVSILRGYGDVVGMTMPSEATLAVEREIDYASMCSVDNYCHGITDKRLAYDDILRNQRMNADKVFSIIKGVIEVLA